MQCGVVECGVVVQGVVWRCRVVKSVMQSAVWWCRVWCSGGSEYIGGVVVVEMV